MAFERECDQCGTSYLAKTKRSLYCSDACKMRHSRSKGSSAGQAAPPPDRGGLVSQVAADLIRSEVLDTIPGRAALALAYRIESPLESGSAAASMTRELTRLVDQALGLTPKRQDGIDDIGAGVEAKLRLVK